MEDRRDSFSAFSSNLTSFSSSKLQALSKCWLTTKEIISSVQPSLSSEQRRKDVVNNIRKLIEYHFGSEVFRFGSVPLKTYIPDGDIDLTVVSSRNVEDLARDICSMLEHEGQKDTAFQVKNLQFIHAQNIAVDISFNQMAGVSALCFLEQVDQFIGKDHLFKQSLILIKAWCYYESRILGAHHALISTYALETLVLYIINFFRSSFNGPLAVLYNFLVYFSTFEWDRYCVSLNGPIPISSFREVLAEMPNNDGDQGLLNKEFLRTCKYYCLGPMRELESSEQEFPIKNLNIIDPLKDSNNLGRSVNTSSFHRIKCALAYGAQKLEDILMLPGENMGEELKKFFATTLDRNRMGQRPDVQVPVSMLGAEKLKLADLTGDSDTSLDSLCYFQWHFSNTIPYPIDPSPPLLASQYHNNSRDAVGRMVQFNRSSFLQRNTCVFAPRELFYPPNKRLPIAGYGAKEMMSLGTCTNFPGMGVPNKANLEILQSIDTHIPHLSPGTIQHSFADMHLSVRGQNLGSSSDGILQKASEDGDRADKNGKSCHPSCFQNPLPSKRRAGQPNMRPSQAKSSSPYSDRTRFGSIVNPPSPSVQNSQSSQEAAPLKQYKLDDEGEFPSLSNRVDASKKLP